ncbi:MAG: thiamine phosphate synthase, partial [Pseudomonadota bacterium]|nr:thiamine phosphate synthase [Pseudomonadota bacterium]
QQHNVAVLLNDRPDLAHDLGCDGVHIGQNDMDYRQARTLLGDKAIIGVTCHASRHLAMLAGDAGADYVAFGAFFDTKTKDTSARPSPDILTWWQEVMEPPCVAIGGITPENGDTLAAAGADFLAVSSGVWQHPEGPVAAVRAFDRIFDAYR